MDGIEALLIPTIQSTSTVIILSEKGNAINLVGVADLSSRQSLTYTTTGEPKTASLPTHQLGNFSFPLVAPVTKSIASYSSLPPLTHNSA
jgi:hypothetical protein